MLRKVSGDFSVRSSMRAVAVMIKSMDSQARWPGFVVRLIHCRLDTLRKISSPL